MSKREKKAIKLYCDGSSLGNPGAGGWGVILEYKGVKKEFSGGVKSATNNQMELQAVIEGLKRLKEPCKVEIVTDSQYIANSINDWLYKWIAKGFKGVKNKELWEEYLRVSKDHDIKAIWVRGHNGHVENERCDYLAKKEAIKFKEHS
ncbi:MAG: ribonuclease HI [Epsilonproteobacteria bacterium]|nr:ribonuclease HI [Campylobacterota bacterium]